MIFEHWPLKAKAQVITQSYTKCSGGAFICLLPLSISAEYFIISAFSIQHKQSLLYQGGKSEN